MRCRAALGCVLAVSALSGCAARPVPRPTVARCASETEARRADRGATEAERAAPRTGEPSQRAPAPSLDELEGTAAALARAFDERLTVWTRADGERVHVAHCRSAPGGCRARIAAMAAILADAADAHGLDPFLLGAVAMRESAIHPGAVGAAGEAGIMQLHPRGLGHDVRFVQDEAYRERCLERADGCQRPLVFYAASRLAEAIARCGGLDRALGLYNGGRCAPRRRYTEHILAERARLRAHASRGEAGELARSADHSSAQTRPTR